MLGDCLLLQGLLTCERNTVYWSICRGSFLVESNNHLVHFVMLTIKVFVPYNFDHFIAREIWTVLYQSTQKTLLTPNWHIGIACSEGPP